MVSKMAPILKQNSTLNQNHSKQVFSDSFQQRLYFGHLTGMLGLFSVMLNIQDDAEDSSNNRVGNDIVVL